MPSILIIVGEGMTLHDFVRADVPEPTQLKKLSGEFDPLVAQGINHDRHLADDHRGTSLVGLVPAGGVQLGKSNLTAQHR